MDFIEVFLPEHEARFCELWDGAASNGHAYAVIHYERRAGRVALVRMDYLVATLAAEKTTETWDVAVERGPNYINERPSR
jgi:hypothetical protein